MEKVLKKIIILNKQEGDTPLQALDAFRRSHKEYREKKMTYAGRLDPMASGLLVVLVGEETKNKEKYLNLGKEYDFEILFGFATDTYDILGKVTKRNVKPYNLKDIHKEIEVSLKYFRGKFIQKYPIYSSKTVKGQQLFEYARKGENVELPERHVEVKKLELLKIRKINNKNLLANITRRIKKVKGDFRQDQILQTWNKKLSLKNSQNFTLARFKIKCSSGTYVRGIANTLGQKIYIPALAFSIKRTKIGKFDRIS